MLLPSRVAAGLMFGLLVFTSAHDSLGQEKPKGPQPPKDVVWKFQALDQAPFKVVSTQYDPKDKAFFWVIELVRDLDVYEDIAHWAPAYKEGRRTRFRFEFHDDDGIIMKTTDGQYVGEYVTKAGKRFGVGLVLPPDLMKYTKTVEAVGK